MGTLRNWTEADDQLDHWVSLAPARTALAEARQRLKDAASLFYKHGERALGDKYLAMAREIPSASS